MALFDELKRRALDICAAWDLFTERIRIKARPLSPEEAIGNPEADDYPLQKGKERLMHAEFRGSFGQAFTDRYGDYEGSLAEVFSINLENNYRRAVFVASLNALLRYTGHIGNTVHCRDQDPPLCAAKLSKYLKKRYGEVKIAQIGFQPRMVETLNSIFDLRVTDLDPDNIDSIRFNTLIEGPEATDEVIHWADVLLVTGTTLVNETIDQFLDKKPVIFYGTTIAGAAHLMGWERFCAYAS